MDYCLRTQHRNLINDLLWWGLGAQNHSTRSVTQTTSRGQGAEQRGAVTGQRKQGWCMPRTVCQMVFGVRGDASGNGQSRRSHRADSDQSRGSHQAGSGQSQGDAEPTAWAGVGLLEHLAWTASVPVRGNTAHWKRKWPISPTTHMTTSRSLT
jgi:hypothetical protein